MTRQVLVRRNPLPLLLLLMLVPARRLTTRALPLMVQALLLRRGKAGARPSDG
jgi:hypothetical protein